MKTSKKKDLALWILMQEADDDLDDEMTLPHYEFQEGSKEESEALHKKARRRRKRKWKGSQIQEGEHQGENPMLQMQRISTYHECV